MPHTHVLRTVVARNMGTHARMHAHMHMYTHHTPTRLSPHAWCVAESRGLLLMSHVSVVVCRRCLWTQEVLSRIPTMPTRVLAYEFAVLSGCKLLSLVGFKAFTPIGV